MERGARLSGSRFAYLRGDLVLLELALVRWVLGKLAAEGGFEPVIPPVLVREQALYGTGFLPDTEQQIYHLPADDLYLAGTSEVALASLHAGEILAEEQLPLRYAGFSPASAARPAPAGRDTRGIFRVHQFDKVEMFSFVTPDESLAEHERLLALEESILQDLQIPYRVVNIAVDDLGASAAKKYDTEGWLPGQERFRELTSTLEHDRLPGPPARHPLPAEATARSRSRCTRSTARRSPSAARSSRCWRTASRRTARSSSRRRSSTPARRPSPPMPRPPGRPPAPPARPPSAWT